MSRSERYLACYSGLLTLVFAIVVLTGAAASRDAKFEQIDVQRINVREADGTLRLVIANNQRAPGIIVRGKESPHPHQGRRGAGMWFYNDEGTESGGLTFSGRRGPDGKTVADSHFSFDQYEQDQVVTLQQDERDGKRMAGLRVLDRPEQPLSEILAEIDRIRALPQPEQDKQHEALMKNYAGGPRIFLGKDDTRASLLDLKDAKNKTRLRLRVAASGEATIEFLDTEGKVQRTLTPETLGTKQ